MKAALTGDASAFVSTRELFASWLLWDPVLQQLQRRVKAGIFPERYPAGSSKLDAELQHLV